MKFTYSSGQRPLDGYTLKRGIGRGGFGEVYYAVSDGGKEVALKLVAAETWRSSCAAWPSASTSSIRNLVESLRHRAPTPRAITGS